MRFQLAANGSLGRGSRGTRRIFDVEKRMSETDGVRVYKEDHATGKTIEVPTEMFEDMSLAWMYWKFETMSLTPREELKVDSLGMRVDQLFADDVYQWAGVVEWIAECAALLR